MTYDHNTVSIHYHMAHHYRRVRRARSVIACSLPKGAPCCKENKLSRSIRQCTVPRSMCATPTRTCVVSKAGCSTDRDFFFCPENNLHPVCPRFEPAARSSSAPPARKKCHDGIPDNARYCHISPGRPRNVCLEPSVKKIPLETYAQQYGSPSGGRSAKNTKSKKNNVTEDDKKKKQSRSRSASRSRDNRNRKLEPDRKRLDIKKVLDNKKLNKVEKAKNNDDVVGTDEEVEDKKSDEEQEKKDIGSDNEREYRKTDSDKKNVEYEEENELVAKKSEPDGKDLQPKLSKPSGDGRLIQEDRKLKLDEKTSGKVNGGLPINKNLIRMEDAATITSRGSRTSEDHEYVHFLLRITEDILINNLYTKTGMDKIFESHMAANRGRLDEQKMLDQINRLKRELNYPPSDAKEVSDESLCKCSERTSDSQTDLCKCCPGYHQTLGTITLGICACDNPLCPGHTKAEVEIRSTNSFDPEKRLLMEEKRSELSKAGEPDLTEESKVVASKSRSEASVKSNEPNLKEDDRSVSSGSKGEASVKSNEPSLKEAGKCAPPKCKEVTSEPSQVPADRVSSNTDASDKSDRIESVCVCESATSKSSTFKIVPQNAKAEEKASQAVFFNVDTGDVCHCTVSLRKTALRIDSGEDDANDYIIVEGPVCMSRKMLEEKTTPVLIDNVASLLGESDTDLRDKPAGAYAPDASKLNLFVPAVQQDRDRDTVAESISGTMEMHGDYDLTPEKETAEMESQQPESDVTIDNLNLLRASGAEEMDANGPPEVVGKGSEAKAEIGSPSPGQGRRKSSCCVSFKEDKPGVTTEETSADALEECEIICSGEKKTSSEQSKIVEVGSLPVRIEECSSCGLSESRCVCFGSNASAVGRDDSPAGSGEGEKSTSVKVSAVLESERPATMTPSEAGSLYDSGGSGKRSKSGNVVPPMAGEPRDPTGCRPKPKPRQRKKSSSAEESVAPKNFPRRVSTGSRGSYSAAIPREVIFPALYDTFSPEERLSPEDEEIFKERPSELKNRYHHLLEDASTSMTSLDFSKLEAYHFAIPIKRSSDSVMADAQPPPSEKFTPSPLPPSPPIIRRSVVRPPAEPPRAPPPAFPVVRSATEPPRTSLAGLLEVSERYRNPVQSEELREAPRSAYKSSVQSEDSQVPKVFEYTMRAHGSKVGSIASAQESAGSGGSSGIHKAGAYDSSASDTSEVFGKYPEGFSAPHRPKESDENVAEDRPPKRAESSNLSVIPAEKQEPARVRYTDSNEDYDHKEIISRLDEIPRHDSMDLRLNAAPAVVDKVQEFRKIDSDENVNKRFQTYTNIDNFEIRRRSTDSDRSAPGSEAQQRRQKRTCCGLLGQGRSGR